MRQVGNYLIVTPKDLTLNGAPVAYNVRDTNSRHQVVVSTTCGSTAQVKVVVS